MNIFTQLTNFISDYIKTARLIRSLEEDGYRRVDFESPNTQGEYGLIPNISYVKVDDDIRSPCRRTMDYYTFVFNYLDISVLHGSHCQRYPNSAMTIWLDANSAYETFRVTRTIEAEEKG